MSATPEPVAVPAPAALDPAPPQLAAGVGLLPPSLRGHALRLWERRATVLRATLVAAGLAVAVSFVLPPVYVASVEVVDSSPTVSGSSLDRMSSRLADLGLASGAPASQVATYPEILRSRRLLTRLLDSPVRSRAGVTRPCLDVLMKPGPRPERLERGIVRLRRTMDVAFDRRTGIVTVRVRARDPQTAADVANRAVALLQDFVVESRNALAGENRRYLEQRLHETEDQLVRAEDALRGFRDSNARFGLSPRLQLVQDRLERAVRVQEEVYVTLNRQRELANLDEQRDVSVLLVLDPAIPPAFRSAPRRLLILAVGIVLGLSVGGWIALEGARRVPRLVAA